jgi:hypothetical protein
MGQHYCPNSLDVARIQKGAQEGFVARGAKKFHVINKSRNKQRG